jgi:hypothetical protein
MNGILRSYLTNGASITKIGGKQSNSLSVVDGIPQGSILRPILFLVYINDLDNDLSNLILFADDICICSSDFNYVKMVNNLQNKFDKIKKWCWANEVYISEEKTVYLEIKAAHTAMLN